MRSINDKFIIFRANYNKMMNRIFHVKIAGGTYFLLILLTAVMVFAFWCMKAMIGLVVALGLIIIIERIIHSTYTLTADGKLVVYYGRFYKGKTIPLIDITDVELKRSSGFIALSVMAINTVNFLRKILKSLRVLSGQPELDENIGTLELFKMLWIESSSKQLIFFVIVNIVAVFMVLVYGTKYALNFYSSISTLNN